MNNVLPWLQKLPTIRQQSQRIFQLVCDNKSQYFSFDKEKMNSTAALVADLILKNYPDLNVPYHSRWRHFEVGGCDRIHQLRARLHGKSVSEFGKIWYELVIISVLLDAGAGVEWKFYDTTTQQYYSRSEGLALASLELYCSGALSTQKDDPFRVDANALSTLSSDTLAKAFQVTEQNPILALEGRTQLLNQLGEVLKGNPDTFGAKARLGNFYNKVNALAQNDTIDAADIFQLVLGSFAAIWPQRLSYKGISLGDVWTHSQLKTGSDGSEYIPFHKLTQWLSYSLLEPLEWAGKEVLGIDALTGLPEYRNGGLFIDMGVITPKSAQFLKESFAPQSELIVEWRALTVVLLDDLALKIQKILAVSCERLPLAKVLQGGTWEAGRNVARLAREDGSPPINIISDGTVF